MKLKMNNDLFVNDLSNGTGTTNTRNFFVATNLNESFGFNLSVVDSNNYVVSAIIYYNGTQQVGLPQTITVDRSAPEVNGVSSPVSGVSSNIFTVNFGFRNATRWRFFHNSIVEETQSVTGALTNTSGSRQISLRDSGSYYVEVFDNTNTTNSETVSYTLAGKIIKSSVVSVKKVAEKMKIVKEIEQKKSNKNILLLGGIFIIVIVVIGYLVAPKVRRRR